MKTRPLYVTVIGLYLMQSVGLYARSIYVNPDLGEDSFPGLSAVITPADGPVKSISKAVQLAQPGDTVYLGGAVFKGRGEFVFVTKSGEPDKPIVIDGQGAVIDGCVPVDPKDWAEIEPGLYKNVTLFKENLKGHQDWASRFSFVMNGKLNRMGHSLKAPSDPYLEPSKLNPGQWTYDINECAYYIKVDPAGKLQDNRIEAPVVVSGAQVSGNISHIVFKNITVKHVINDGFALTVGTEPNSKVHDIFYEHITAIECCDDGFSAHGDCDVRVDGFLADGCGTGICSQGNSINSRIVTRNIHAADIYFGSGRHVITDSYFDCHGRLGSIIAMVWPNAYGYTDCSLTLKNVIAKGNKVGRDMIKAEGKGARLECSQLLSCGLSLTVRDGATLTLNDSIVAGGQSLSIDCPSGTVWQANGNTYDIGFIHIDKNSYSVNEFSAYKQAGGQDADSKWIPVNCDVLPESFRQYENNLSGADISIIRESIRAAQ